MLNCLVNIGLIFLYTQNPSNKIRADDSSRQVLLLLLSQVKLTSVGELERFYIFHYWKLASWCYSAKQTYNLHLNCAYALAPNCKNRVLGIILETFP